MPRVAPRVLESNDRFSMRYEVIDETEKGRFHDSKVEAEFKLNVGGRALVVPRSDRIDALIAHWHGNGEWREWGHKECAAFITLVGLEVYADAFEENVTGEELERIESRHLISMGVQYWDDQRAMMAVIRRLRNGNEHATRLPAAVAEAVIEEWETRKHMLVFAHAAANAACEIANLASIGAMREVEVAMSFLQREDERRHRIARGQIASRRESVRQSPFLSIATSILRAPWLEARDHAMCSVTSTAALVHTAIDGVKASMSQLKRCERMLECVLDAIDPECTRTQRRVLSAADEKDADPADVKLLNKPLEHSLIERIDRRFFATLFVVLVYVLTTSILFLFLCCVGELEDLKLQLGLWYHKNGHKSGEDLLHPAAVETSEEEGEDDKEDAAPAKRDAVGEAIKILFPEARTKVNLFESIMANGFGSFSLETVQRFGIHVKSNPLPSRAPQSENGMASFIFRYVEALDRWMRATRREWVLRHQRKVVTMHSAVMDIALVMKHLDGDEESVFGSLEEYTIRDERGAGKHTHTQTFCNMYLFHYII